MQNRNLQEKTIGTLAQYHYFFEVSVTGTRDFQNGLCVKSTLNDSYANITSIYARQQEWAESNGYDFIRSPFELYITEPNATNTPDDDITEIYYPVIKRR